MLDAIAIWATRTLTLQSLVGRLFVSDYFGIVVDFDFSDPTQV
jgi:hypothetical protein